MIIITTVVENENGKDIAIGLDVDGKNTTNATLDKTNKQSFDALCNLFAIVTYETLQKLNDNKSEKE